MNEIKTVSPEQLEANRQNAQNSTGPKTPEGKAKAKMNALKHGVRASSALIKAYKFRESSKDFTNLFEVFHEALAPVGPVEEALVNRIIMALWRLRRLHIAEAGEIAKSINGSQSSGEVDLKDMFLAMPGNDLGFSSARDTVASCKHLCKELNELLEAIERDGQLNKDELAGYYQKMGRPNHSIIDELIDVQDKFATNPKSAELGSIPAIKEHLKQELLTCLRRQIRDAKSRLEVQLELRSAEQRADKSAALLPSVEALDKIMRYEASLEKQIYRALGQLERLQRSRQGETMPPPISMVL
jgi:hypothetical protein